LAGPSSTAVWIKAAGFLLELSEAVRRQDLHRDAGFAEEECYVPKDVSLPGFDFSSLFLRVQSSRGDFN